ncbi:hypothetical protein [Spiroplasma poulsonii]|uniref:hypothetical protein n=1 Tax=Spiroplasma poulsonii TaxID=2138 RepID=UPI001F4C8115|nr:hypothetical protein [Spiroplasma poulsonii]UNF61347.1 hypothetical protein MNU24_05375 [Spiroplasma poulsonii]
MANIMNFLHYLLKIANICKKILIENIILINYVLFKRLIFFPQRKLIYYFKLFNFK